MLFHIIELYRQEYFSSNSFLS